MPPDTLIQPKTIRCAIYTRKSTEDGLEQDFNSLDAQRECAEAYVRSQQHEHWTALPDLYDDGGFSGANIERPALRQLLADIEAGLIDCVIVYKVDRLSRSLLDFARIMGVFDKQGVSFVSVTQQFNTTSPMGRLTLNVLLSFAQFEREIISERTRDKMVAARRKGKWTGGFPPLGYDPDPVTRKLAINLEEAARVREMFRTFVLTGSLAETLEDIERRDWRTKNWVTRKHKQRGGARWDRPALRHLLANVLYIGEVSHDGTRYPGEQEAIVDRKTWDCANQLLSNRKRGLGVRERKRHSPLLARRLICAICNRAMVHGYTTKGGRRYRYYLCQTARKGRANTCPGQMVAAHRIEQAVRAKLFELAREPGRPKLAEALRLHPVDWDSLGSRDQHAVLDDLIREIAYDHRSQEAWFRLEERVSEPASAGVIRIPIPKDPSGRRFPVPGCPSQAPPPPRAARLMALALRFERLLQTGAVLNYPELARQAGMCTTRVSQILKLRNLAPAIQERLLFLAAGPVYLPEPALRRISEEIEWSQQLNMFNQLFPAQPAGTATGPE